MNDPAHRDATHESNQTLWLLTISPTIWAVHFLACYLTAAIWCAKMGRDSTLWNIRIAIAVYTAVALVGIAVTGWAGYRRHSFGASATPHDYDTPGDRHRFLGFATMLLSGLSALATIFSALVAAFMETCH